MGDIKGGENICYNGLFKWNFPNMYQYVLQRFSFLANNCSSEWVYMMPLFPNGYRNICKLLINSWNGNEMLSGLSVKDVLLSGIAN